MAPGDGIRRNVAQISEEERGRFINAILALDTTKIYPDGVTYWDKQEDIHKNAHAAGQDVHAGPAFVPWHRELCNRLEGLLREVDPTLSLHYWDWTTDPRVATADRVALFTNIFMGSPNGNAGAPLGNFESTEITGDPTNGFPGDGIHDHIWRKVNNGNPGAPAMASDQNIVTAGDGGAPATQYHAFLQAVQSAHNTAHGYIGGTIGLQHFSFHDPFVFLLHSNQDRLWAMWQLAPGKAWRLDPNQVYGHDGTSSAITGNLEPWSGGSGLRPWTAPDNQQVVKTCKHPSVVAPPLYDTNPVAVPKPTGGWVTAWGNNRLDIFGLGTDGAMYHKAWDGATWRPSPLDWERLGGVFTSPPAVTAWGNNRLDIFGLGTDGAMYHKAWDGTAWRPSPLDWERLGGIFTSPPAVTAWGNNRLDIFGLGMDGAMYHKAWDGTAWRPSPLDWERLGGVFTSPPAVTAWGNNRLDIFGLGMDGAMYHKAWDGTAWRPSLLDWERLGGVFTSPPAVTAWGNNRLDIFGLGMDGAMYHKAWDGAAWRPSPLDWERLGGVFTSPPAVTAWGNNRLDIFGLGMDGAMYHKAWDGTAWRPSPLDWERLGGVFTSPPAVTAWGNNRLDTFGLGLDGAMYHKAWDGAAWRPSPLDWERLGGVFTAP